MGDNHKKGIKLFGFKLTETSALLLFIFSFSLILIGAFGLYTVIEEYNDIDYLSPIATIIYVTLLTLGLYILVKTVRFRNK